MFSEMTSEEKDVIAHKMVIHQFFFTKRLAKALNGGQGCMEVEMFILQETVKGLEDLKNLINEFNYNFFFLF